MFLYLTDVLYFKPVLKVLLRVIWSKLFSF